jgi:hypothetical protein
MAQFSDPYISIGTDCHDFIKLQHCIFSGFIS